MISIVFLAFILPLVASLSSLSAGSATSSTLLEASRARLPPDCLAHQSAVQTGFVAIRQASAAKGLGAFATQDIKFGDYIGQYFGEIMTRKEVTNRYFDKTAVQDDADQRWKQDRIDRNQGVTGNYVFEMKNGSFVCAEDGDRSGWCRFMNHAEEDSHLCNVRAFDKLTVEGEWLVYPQFFATRDIEKGEELCYCYGEHFFQES